MAELEPQNVEVSKMKPISSAAKKNVFFNAQTPCREEWNERCSMTHSCQFQYKKKQRWISSPEDPMQARMVRNDLDPRIHLQAMSYGEAFACVLNTTRSFVL